jgi:hypothetical protein
MHRRSALLALCLATSCAAAPDDRPTPAAADRATCRPRRVEPGEVQTARTGGEERHYLLDQVGQAGCPPGAAPSPSTGIRPAWPPARWGSFLPGVGQSL